MTIAIMVKEVVINMVIIIMTMLKLIKIIREGT